MTHQRIGVARGVLFAAALAAAACEGRPQAGGSYGAKSTPRSGPAVVVLDLSVGIPEKEQAGLLGPAPGRRRSFDSLLKTIDQARHDKSTRGFYVHFGQTTFGLARAQELGEKLAGVRKDQPVYCQADALDNATLMAAALGCSKIYVAPAGEVAAVGIAAQMIYMRKLLADELHLSIDMLQVGKFKGAEEPLTRDGPSDEARQSLESVLVDLRRAWLEGIAKGRAGQQGAAVAAEDGPFSAPGAKARGLIDEVGYDDDALEAAKKACGAVRSVVRYGSGAHAAGPAVDDVLRIFAGDESSEPQVMVLRAVGSISSGGGSLFGDSGITDRELVRRAKRAADDDAIKAVVLRIDSPGGSALASDLIWHALMKLREKKPLVVSVGGMAASGGYYLASTGNEIFAEPTSIVGSIGVVGGKVAVGDALEQIGVHAETFSAKPGDPAAATRAGYESPLIAWDDATRQRVFESMKGIYDLFLSRVAEGRKTTVDKIAVSAEGRIFSGTEGKARGLVDTLGGLDAAIARARVLGGLPPDAPARVYSPTPKWVELLGGQDDGVKAPVSGLTGPVDLSWIARAAPDIVPYASSLLPLATGEHSLCALPFALRIR